VLNIGSIEMSGSGSPRLIGRRLIRAASALAIFAGGAAGSTHGADQTATPADEKPLVEARCPIRDPQHEFQGHVWSWSELKEKNVVKQVRDYSCGAASLCTLLRYYWGDNITEQKILNELDKMLTPAERKDRIQEGLSLTDLRKVCVKMGYLASIGTLTFEQLSQSKIPVLVGMKIGKFYHFAVFRGTDGYYVYLADPARGNIRGTVKEFTEIWQKGAILVVAKKDQDLKENSPLSLKAEDSYLGTLNRFTIQQLISQPLVIARPSVRP
jgi:uncharacterized protein